MEDQERKVATHNDEEPPLTGKAPRPSDLTVMVLGKVGKFRSFKISSRVFFWSSVFFVLYILLSVIVINAYFGQLRTGRIQSELLVQLQDEIKETKRSLHRSKHHLTLLEESIHNFIASTEQQAKASMLEAPAQVKDYPAFGSETVEEDEQQSIETLVNVEELTVHKKETKLEVNFRLANAHQEDDPVSGYIHIIAINREVNPPLLWTYPKVALENGLPGNYKRGQLFLIRHFKAIRGEFPLNSSTAFPNTIEVIVYDTRGKLIFQKKFEVQNAA